MGSHSDGVVASVECNELRLEHDVAIDLKVGGRGLQTTKAGCLLLMMKEGRKRRERTSAGSIDLREIDIITLNSRHVVSSNIDLEIR